MKKLLILIALLLAAPSAHATATVSITVDHGTSLTLSAPASSVFIANPDIADVQVMSPTQVMIFGKRTGETTFMASDSRGHTLAQRTISVSQDLSELRAELNAAIPGNSIKATPVPNGIVLTGLAKDATAVADAYKIAMRYMPAGGDIINRVQVNGSNQINIRVRFAEVQRSVDNTLGFDLQNIAQIGGGMMVGLATGNAVSATGTGTFNTGSETGLFPRPNNTSLSLPNDILGTSYVGKHLNLNGMIDALAQEGFVTILAEPNLTAMSGETANFLAGGEFPIPIPQGNGTISIQFQPYGISLAFTPTLMNGNRISLHVRPEVSELTTAGSIILNNITVPALLTRKAETTVEVGSGESFAIAGLMDNSQSQTINKFPLLGDMPILGALFRSDHFQNGQTELMVIITPYIVKPSNDQLALPTDGLAPPAETERLVGLRSSSGDPNARPMSGDAVGALAAPAPAAAPTMPVTTTTNAQNTAPNIVPNAPDVIPDTTSMIDTQAVAPVAPASDSTPVPAPVVMPVVATAPPVILHPAKDIDKHSGGILVE